jgi:mannose-6-phosphate isomerase-like protein (cupin superfamily)
MKPTRRELAALLPALAAAQTGAPAPKSKLPSKPYLFEDFAVKESNGNKSRAVLDGLTHTGYDVELHITELGPGLAPHAAHRHTHEEVVMLRSGTLDVTIEGKTTRVTPGSVVFVASNELHGWKNAGEAPAQYFVIALGRNA